MDITDISAIAASLLTIVCTLTGMLLFVMRLVRNSDRRRRHLDDFEAATLRRLAASDAQLAAHHDQLLRLDERTAAQTARIAQLDDRLYQHADRLARLDGHDH